jgi:hypothetical protein
MGDQMTGMFGAVRSYVFPHLGAPHYMALSARLGRAVHIFKVLVALHFVPFHFVPGHFVPVISFPHTFRPRSFRPQSFRFLVISSPRTESKEVHALRERPLQNIKFHIHTLQKLLQASYYMTNDLWYVMWQWWHVWHLCEVWQLLHMCHCKYNLNIIKW